MRYSSKTKLLFLITLFVVPMILGSVPSQTHAYTECVGVETGDRVNVDYVLTIQGDTEPFQEGDDFEFVVNTQNVIQGFYEGVLGMRIGDRKEIIVPPSKGYDTGELAGETLIFNVYLKQVLSGIQECSGASNVGGSSFGSSLANILEGIFIVGGLGILGVYGYYYTQKTTTPACAHCKTEGRDRLSEGKCAKCNTHYCRQSFSRGCPNCKANSFVPN